MGLVVVDAGMLRDCDQVSRSWPRPRRIGLYANDPTISRHTVLADLQPATFSGYAGLRTLGLWTTPGMIGDRAVSRCAPVEWTYDGGQPTGWVVGCYYLDQDGTLLYVDRREPAPVAMVVTGQVYRIVPEISSGTRFGGTT